MLYMPKTGTLLFISVLLQLQLLAAPAQISLPNQNATPGSNFVLPVTFQSGSGPISGVQFDLQYDNTAMTLTATVGNAANNAGKVLYAVDLASNMKRFLITG